jgi:ketosteroid isomerase-like protein
VSAPPPHRIPLTLGPTAERQRVEELTPDAMAAALRLPPGTPERQERIVAYLRAVYAAINRGDVAAAAALAVPGYELHIAADGLGPGAGMAAVYHGRAGVLQAAEDFLSPFDRFRYEPSELIDAGDRFVVLLHLVARGRGSGAEGRQTLGIVYEVQDGVVARERHYWDWGNALRSVGVEP